MLIDNTYIYEVKSIGLSVRKGRKPQNLLVAARHNLREIQAENGADSNKIDSRRMHLNEVLIGPSSAREVLENANRLFNEAGIDQSKLRKDYNQASEHVFSLRLGQVEHGFFSVIARGAIQIFGAENVLSFVVHRDQDNPHAHMLVSPISDGKYLGSKLHMREPLAMLKAEFARYAETIGFQPVPEKKIRRQKLTDMAATIVAYLEHAKDPLLFHPQWQVILHMLIKDPLPLYLHLNLESVYLPSVMSQDRLVSDQHSSRQHKNFKKPFARKQNLTSVGFNRAEGVLKADHTDPTGETDGHSIRVHDAELSTEKFDYETGEIITPSYPKRVEKDEADMCVNYALSFLRSSNNRNLKKIDLQESNLGSNFP